MFSHAMRPMRNSAKSPPGVPIMISSPRPSTHWNEVAVDTRVIIGAWLVTWFTTANRCIDKGGSEDDRMLVHEYE